jgi:peptidyl-dipeptidase Dcp
MLAQDTFAWFESHGGLTRENGQRFRDMVLSRGNTLDYGEMYRAFTGHDPDINPYLEYYGLPTTAAAAPATTPAASPSPAPAAAPAPSPQKGERGR